MNYVYGSKPLLAKLLTEEDINLVHKDVKTACFSIETRTIILPFWKDISNDLYDLLVSHEVAHAIWTPQDFIELAESRNESFMNVLNVFEDVRCEKKIKRKYPGLKKSFHDGYYDIMERFNVDSNTECPLNRINLLCKAPFVYSFVLTDKEQYFFDKVRKLESWEETVELTEEFIDYYSDSDSFDEVSFEYFESGGNEEKINISPNTGKNIGNNSSERLKNSNDNSSEESSDTSPEESSDNSSNSSGGFSSSENDNNPFESSFQNIIDDFVNNSVETDLDKIPHTINIPGTNNELCVFPSSVFIDLVRKSGVYHTESILDDQYNDMTKRISKYVTMLVKEFEMKKSARDYYKGKEHESGDLDINRLPFYKLDDRIFLKNEIFHKGKNHGMVILLDCSASMQDNLVGSVEQIISLVLFCKKVNIPFEVYGFFSYTGFSKNEKWFERILNGIVSMENCFSLVQFTGSDLRGNDFKDSLTGLFCFSKGKMYDLRLSSTPAIESYLVMVDILNSFRERYKVEKLSFILIADGDSQQVFYEDGGRYMNFNKSYSYIFKNDKYKYLSYVPEAVNVQMEILKYLKHSTGAIVSCFYICRYSYSFGSKYRSKSGKNIDDLSCDDRVDLNNNFKKLGYVESFHEEYDRFYFINDSNRMSLGTEEEIDVNSYNFNLKRAINTFKKNKTKSKASKFLIAKVVEAFNS